MTPPKTPNTPPNISDAEWLVMRVLWARSPDAVTVSDVTDALESQTGWKLKTVQTLLNRLVKKGALEFEKRGRAYHYFPVVEESACVRAETRSFLHRITGGALKPMLAHFLEEGELSQEEMAELKRMIEERESLAASKKCGASTANRDSAGSKRRNAK